jgi:hypothetical protein
MRRLLEVCALLERKTNYKQTKRRLVVDVANFGQLQGDHQVRSISSIL